jgi:glutaredoxin 3
MKNRIFNYFVLFILIVGGIRFYTKYTENAVPEGSELARHTTVRNVLIYSKEGCSYCAMAKSLLDQKNIKYEIIELGNNQDLFTKLVNQTGQKTVPYVFIDDKFIGGYQDLKGLDDSGNL